jgi:hypothetical protein
MAEVSDYTDKIPNYNAQQPVFMATLSSLLAPLVDSQNFLATIPSTFDLDVAVGVQLDQTGLWIGRTRDVQTPITGVYFSWDTDNLGWEQGYWQGAFDPDEGVSALDDSTFRALLYAKVAANKWDSTIDGIVTALEALFAGQAVTVEVIDNQDMTLTVNVTGTLTDLVFRAIVEGGYIPIKPVGIGINYNLPAGLVSFSGDIFTSMFGPSFGR